MINNYESFLLEATRSRKVKDFTGIENVCSICGSRRLDWGHQQNDFPNHKLIRHYSCENCKARGILKYELEFIENDLFKFDEFVKRLDVCINNNDFSGFINIYNNNVAQNRINGTGNANNRVLLAFQERYKKLRPENIDIIDAYNIGILN